MKSSSPSRRRALGSGRHQRALLTGGLLTSGPGHLLGGARRPLLGARRGGKVVDTGHEPKHPLEDQGQARRAAAGGAGGASSPARRSVPPTTASRDARARGHRPDLRGPRGVRRPALHPTDAGHRIPGRTPPPQPQRFDGPLHNQIPEPDRSVDNTTLWQPDYDRAHYEDMYFNRMAEYYEQQSSGRYSVDGDVTEWVKVPFNEALYGRDYCGDIVCSQTPGPDPRRPGHLGPGPARRRADDGRDPGLPEDVRRAGPLRHRRRRQLRRAGRLHRPLPDRPRGWRRGGGRPDLRLGRDLEPPLVRNLQAGGPGGFPGVNIGSNGGATPRRGPTNRSRTTRPASGSATTPSSPRTAGSASSRTSSATTSVCRTSTTPPATPAAPRTRPGSGR